MARYVMLIDSEKCMNCKACLIACQQRNEVPRGLSRNWVRETPDAKAPGLFRYQPGACMHCDDASCVRSCPTGATFKSRDGAVEIDRARCIGCGSCIEACPYDARFRNPITGTADKCDFCRRSTPGQTPACVAICPMNCRIFGDADDPSSEVAKAIASGRLVHVVPLGSNAKPTLAYLGATTPSELPAGKTASMPIDTMRPLARGLQLAGGLVLAALGGTIVRQAIRNSEKEDAEIAAEKEKASASAASAAKDNAREDRA